MLRKDQTGCSPSYISRGKLPGNKTPLDETISQPQSPHINYPPTPPTSPPKLKRKHSQSELDLTQPPYPRFETRCLVLTKDNLPGPTLSNFSFRRRLDMIPNPKLENENDPPKESSPADRRSNPERINNAATKTLRSIESSPVVPSIKATGSQVCNNIMGSMGEGSGSSSSQVGPSISNLRPPKRRRYIEFDELTGREIITERLPHLESTSGEHTRLIYSSSASRGYALGSSRQARSWLVQPTPLSDASTESPFQNHILRSTVCAIGMESKVTTCKSPEPISQDSSVCESLDEKGMVERGMVKSYSEGTRKISDSSLPALIQAGSNSKSPENLGDPTQDHLMTPVVTRVSTPVASCSTLADCTTPLGSPNFLSDSASQPASSNVSNSHLYLNGEKTIAAFQGKGSGEATTLNPSGPIRQAVRRKPPPLPLAAQAGNFATLAGSRERRQPASIDTHGPIFRAPFPGSPISSKSNKSVPVTPTSDTSRRSSYSRIGSDQADPQFRPLSPVEPVDGAWLSQVPPEVCQKVIETQVGLFPQNHIGAMPLHPTYAKNRVKGKYRIALDTDKPNLQDFIIVSTRNGLFKKHGNDADDEDMDTEEGSSSTFVERWSGGNVKGPKNRVLEKHMQKRMMVSSGGKLLGTNLNSRVTGNIATSKVTSAVRLKSLNSTIVTRRRRTTSHGMAAITQAGDGIILPLSVEDDEGLVKGAAALDHGPGPTTNVTGTKQIGRTTTAIGGSVTSAGSILRPRPPQDTPANYSLQMDILTETLTSATESTISNFTSDTEISSDEDIIPSSSLFGHRTARCASSSTIQSRALRKENQANAIRLTEGGPNGKDLGSGSTSIFSIGQSAAVGGGVMGPPAAKVSPAELRLYIGRRGDQVPLFGNGGKMTTGLGSIPLHEYTAPTYDGHSVGTSGILQPGGIVEVRRVQDPLLEAIIEVKRLIFEAGHQAGLVPEAGILGGLLVDKVYWSGEREASLNKPYSGIGVDFSGRPLVKAVTFVNPLSNHTYTLLFVWAFLPVNTPEKNREHAVGNSMALSGEVRGDGASDTRSDDVRESFQVHVCVGKPGRVQKKEDRRRVVFVQVVAPVKGGRGSRATSAMSSDSESIKWERWELDGLMRGLTRLWLQNARGQIEKTGPLPRVTNRSAPNKKGLHAGSTSAADPIGAWLEHDVLCLHGSPSNANGHIVCSPKLQQRSHKVMIDNTDRPFSLLPAVIHTSNCATAHTPVPLYLQGPESEFSSGVSGGLPPPPASSPLPLPSPQPTKVLTIDPYASGLQRSEAVRRGKHRKKVLWDELCREVLVDFADGEIEPEDQGFENSYWWQV